MGTLTSTDSVTVLMTFELPTLPTDTHRSSRRGNHGQVSSGFAQVTAWLKLRRDRDNLPVPLSPESCGRGANTVAGLICDGRTGTTPSMTSDRLLADTVSGPSHPPSASGAGSPPRHRPFTKRRRGQCKQNSRLSAPRSTARCPPLLRGSGRHRGQLRRPMRCTHRSGAV